MISRQLRAVLKMTVIWTTLASTIAGTLSLWFWLNRDTSFSGENFLYWVITDVMLPFLITGALGGAAFSLFLAYRGRSRTLNEITTRINIQWWILLGAIAGSIGYTAFLALFGALDLWAPMGMMIFGVLAAAAGGVLGSGMMAIARRGTAIEGVEEKKLLR